MSDSFEIYAFCNLFLHYLRYIIFLLESQSCFFCNRGFVNKMEPMLIARPQ